MIGLQISIKTRVLIITTALDKGYQCSRQQCNKNSNTQGSSPNVVKVIHHTLRNCSYRKEFAPSGSKFLPLREISILKREVIVEAWYSSLPLIFSAVWLCHWICDIWIRLGISCASTVCIVLMNTEFQPSDAQIKCKFNATSFLYSCMLEFKNLVTESRTVLQIFAYFPKVM